jgi:hypothetical protein
MHPRDVEALTHEEYVAMVEYMSDLARQARKAEARQPRRLGG